MVDTGELVQRGCSSDIDVNENCLNGNKCVTCDKNECNNQGIIQTCIKCEGIDCLNPTEPGKNCNSVLGHEECYTYNNGETVSRGCLSDADVSYQNSCSSSGDVCKTCQGQNCNDQNEKLYSTCIVCESTENGSCRQSLNSERCSDNSGCYIFVSGMYFYLYSVHKSYYVSLFLQIIKLKEVVLSINLIHVMLVQIVKLAQLLIAMMRELLCHHQN